MNKVNESLNGILVCLFDLLVGILLLVSPVSFTSGIIISFGVVLLILGLTFTLSILFIRYCR